MKNLILIYLLLIFTLSGNTNPLGEFISDEDYNIAIEKFHSDKDIFKANIIDRDAMLEEIRAAESRVKSVFTEVSATMYSDNKYGAIIYYNDPKIARRQRLVILGEKAIRLDSYVYYLIPYDGGVRIKDIRTGNFYKIETRGRWINAKKKFYPFANTLFISFYYL